MVAVVSPNLTSNSGEIKGSECFLNRKTKRKIIFIHHDIIDGCYFFYFFFIAAPSLGLGGVSQQGTTNTTTSDGKSKLY